MFFVWSQFFFEMVTEVDFKLGNVGKSSKNVKKKQTANSTN